MKRVIVAILAFTIGVLGVDLLRTKDAAVLEISPVEQPLIEAPKYPPTKIYSYEDFTPEKNENLKPFFDSFKSNDGYSGWFIPEDFKGMPEVWTILLDSDLEETPKGEKMIWSAMVLTQHPDGSPNDDDSFESVQIKTVGNRLSFKTNKIRGIEYKFDGEFFVNGKSFDNDEKVLRGTMQKILKGKRITKFTADFAYHEPRCYH